MFQIKKILKINFINILYEFYVYNFSNYGKNYSTNITNALFYVSFSFNIFFAINEKFSIIGIVLHIEA